MRELWVMRVVSQEKAKKCKEQEKSSHRLRD